MDAPCSENDSAVPYPKMSDATSAPTGVQRPKIIAAGPMNPRPPVMPSVNECATESERYAPPSAASIPEAITAQYRVCRTAIPTVSAARGCSPTARKRRPGTVRKRKTWISDEREAGPDDRILVRDDIADERDCGQRSDLDIGDTRKIRGCSGRSVELVVKI